MSEKKELTRRSFIQILTGTVLMAPALFSVRSLWATKIPLPEGALKPIEEIPAKKGLVTALGYNPDAAKVDTARFKKFKEGQNCANCSQYVKLNEGWGTCKILPGGLVTAAGWCNSYVAVKK